ncbi:MAG: hypothetical protein JW909_00480 [Planctomycetes bacterium]|nr:hypothetical protein [Planctomycetota bacterium]
MSRAVTLVSGGLDSALALALMKRQNVDIFAVHFSHIFQPYTGGNPACDVARCAGVELHFHDLTPSILASVRSPRHGFGKNLNPCIDCRICQLRIAHRLMKEHRCDFIVTGEVIGQRPMSQRADAVSIIDRDAGVEGLVLRPLSAAHLPETVPEKSGLVDRSLLMAFRGRTRRPQLDLAAEFGISGFTSPAGGCLLTDPGFSLRFKELLQYSDSPAASDIELLKCGRHFRLGHDTKAVIGRNEKDNSRIMALARDGDVIVRTAEDTGPDTLIRGDVREEHVYKAAEITARYSRHRRDDLVPMVAFRPPSEEVWRFIEVSPADEIETTRLAIAPPRPFG